MRRFAIAVVMTLLLSSGAAADWFPGDPPPAWEWKHDYNHYPACGSWSVQMPCDKVA